MGDGRQRKHYPQGVRLKDQNKQVQSHREACSPQEGDLRQKPESDILGLFPTPEPFRTSPPALGQSQCQSGLRLFEDGWWALTQGAFPESLGQGLALRRIRP